VITSQIWEFRNFATMRESPVIIENFQRWSIESTKGTSIRLSPARKARALLAKLLALFIQFHAQIPAMLILFV
jgi:hypothetical protein